MATDASTLKQSIIDYLNNQCGWDVEKSIQGGCLAEAVAEAVTQHIKDYAETSSADGHTHDVV